MVMLYVVLTYVQNVVITIIFVFLTDCELWTYKRVDSCLEDKAFWKYEGARMLR